MKEKILKYLKICFESFLWVALLVIIADFVTKQIVLHNMQLGQTIPEKTGFMYLQYVINDGMAFGINFNLNGDAPLANQIIFICISIIGSGIISFIYFRNYKKLDRLTKISLGLMLAGCIGNMIDRIFYSQSYLSKFSPAIDTNGVVDFIAVDFGTYQFPRFNIADSSLVIGALILIVYLIYQEIVEAKARRKQELASMPEGKVLSKDEQVIMNKTSEEAPQSEEKQENNEESN